MRPLIKDMFLTMGSIFPNGATEADLLTIYRPRPGLPFSIRHTEKRRKTLAMDDLFETTDGY